MPAKRRSRRSNKKSFSQRVQNVIKKQAEVKYCFGATTDSSITSSSGVQHNCMTGIDPGDSSIERIGDKVKLKDLQVHLTLKSGTVTDSVRVYLYQVRGESAAPNYLKDIYPKSFFPTLEETGGHTYKVLFNRVYSMSPGMMDCKFLKLNIPAKKLLIDEIQFEAGTSTVVDGLILLGIETSNGSGNEMTAQVDSKLRFYD